MSLRFCKNKKQLETTLLYKSAATTVAKSGNSRTENSSTTMSTSDNILITTTAATNYSATAVPPNDEVNPNKDSARETTILGRTSSVATPNYIDIPFNGIPKDAITKEFLVAICGSQDEEKISTLREMVTQWKGQLNQWSGHKVKAQLVEIAMSLVGDKNYSNVTVPGADGSLQQAKTFNDVRRWWCSCSGSDKDVKTYQEICYGWWKQNKGWELKWETEWMTLNN
jgi:hypothetical protein